MDRLGTAGPSPFHAGEQDAQERSGVREKIEIFARKAVRDHMPDQHREFYGLLPFLMIGSVDTTGRPWASLIAGPEGFLTTPDDRSLAVDALPLPGDPLSENLEEGAELGVLGIQPATRRRNRLTGRVAQIDDKGFRIAVNQTFGNCPQYIQTRQVDWQPQTASAAVIAKRHHFSAADRALIETADTLFIATASGEGVSGSARGADVSHRGGSPGFVRVEDDRSFVFPDYSGNFHFNTVGNILLNPRAGFLFVDFAAGGLLYLTGSAEVVWEGELLDAFAGAERLIRFHLDEAVFVAGSLPLCFDFGDYSPNLAMTGSWEQTEQRLAADRERNTYVDYEVAAVERESGTISSFYLRRVDGKAPASYKAGQFLPIRVEISGRDAPVTRTYTLSGAPGGALYRLSIKREGDDGLVSNILHDQAKAGFRLQAMGPRGKFVLDENSKRPVVLISGGVGITPMMAMAQHLINEGKRTRRFRRTYFIHGARNGSAHAFGPAIRDLAAEHDSLTAHIRYSRPGGGDRLGETHDSEGRVDAGLLQQLLPLDDYDFYLCGPAPFMQSLYQSLSEMGVGGERIFYESFGPASLLSAEVSPKSPGLSKAPVTDPVAVRFDATGEEVSWTPEKGTLLELAESAGLSPAFACRSGICGTCATRVKCGSVDYIDEPTGPREDDEVLICCSTPRPPGSGSAETEAGCGTDLGVVLDL